MDDRPAPQIPNYPGGGPREGESLREYEHRVWAELDEGIKQRAVEHLRGAMSDSLKAQTRELMAKAPEGWIVPYHFNTGMAIRNMLREVIKDDELPSGNWDDYYVRAVEEAVAS
jgi:hypothetical protein